jgi:hypothetical protein
MLALMLGPEHFGLPVGDIFKVGSQWENGLHTQCRKGTNWFTYLLPPPCSIEGKIHGLCGKNTCFIVLLLFLMFPDLKFVPAFNEGASDWTDDNLTVTECGEILIGHDPLTGEFANIYCRDKENQRELRKKLGELQPGIKFFGPVAGLKDTTAARTHTVVIRNAKRGIADLQSADASDDSDDSDEQQFARALAISREAGFTV